MRNTISGAQTVLVIDNNRETLETVSHLLKLEDYQTATSVDSRAALAVLDLLIENNLSLVILGTTMLRIDSLQILSLVKQYYSVPILMLAEECETGLLQKALAMGADGYVEKSLLQETLLGTVKTMLNRYNSIVSDKMRDPLLVT